MPLKLARRMENLGTETAFEVLAKARKLEAQGKNIVHLEIGEPDFPTPPNIVEAAQKAIRDGFTHYTPAGGLMPARQAVADWIRRTYEVDVQPEQVVMVPGSKNVLLFTILALIDEGTEAIVPDPGYPIYESLVTMAGGKAVPIALRERNEFRLDVEELKGKITPRTRLIVINAPHNPTGGVLSHKDLEAIAELAQRHDLYVLSDEVYGQITYDGHHASILTVPGMVDRTIYSDGLSKAYAMCGWRLGFAVAPLPLAQRMETLMINSSSCAAAFTQMAAIEALERARAGRPDAVRRGRGGAAGDVLRRDGQGLHPVVVRQFGGADRGGGAPDARGPGEDRRHRLRCSRSRSTRSARGPSERPWSRSFARHWPTP